MAIILRLDRVMADRKISLGELAGRVGIEVKCRHAGRAALVRQAQKYLRCEALDALVVATRSGVDLPRHIAGKPVATVCLSRNWGIAL